MNQKRRRSNNSRPAVSLDPLYRGEDQEISRKSKDLIEPSESSSKLVSASKTLDKSAWSYPRVAGNAPWIALGLGLLGLLWGYAPTILDLATAWEREPDY
jgi:hypothetical protein